MLSALLLVLLVPVSVAEVGGAEGGASLSQSQLRKEFAAMKVSALKHRARAEGIEQELIDGTDDAENPRAALTELLLQGMPERSDAPTPPRESEPLTSGAEQYDVWKEWDGMFSANDGIEKLVATDFEPPAFYLRDSPDIVWVVLYCMPSSRGCRRTAEMYKELAGLLRGDRRARLGVVSLGTDLSTPTEGDRPSLSLCLCLCLCLWLGVCVSDSVCFNTRTEGCAYSRSAAPRFHPDLSLQPHRLQRRSECADLPRLLLGGRTAPGGAQKSGRVVVLGRSGSAAEPPCDQLGRRDAAAGLGTVPRRYVGGGERGIVGRREDCAGDGQAGRSALLLPLLPVHCLSLPPCVQQPDATARIVLVRFTDCTLTNFSKISAKKCPGLRPAV